MKTFRMLSAATASLFLMLLFAYAYAMVIRLDGGFYCGLNLPTFKPTNLLMEILEPINYGVQIWVVATLVSKRNFKAEFWFLVLTNVLSLFVLVFMFALKSVFWATMLMGLTLILEIVTLIKLAVRKNAWLPYLFTVALNSYLFVVLIWIASNN
ncbi:MAG: hypothetical protein SPG87_03995 [Eubacteriales bacterium]|nr:hypothetical protein [Eubacteriales bacterium]